MIFVSIGIDCGTANILKWTNLRNCSFPFDWVVTFEGVSDIIKSDFVDYIPTDCEQLNKMCGVWFLHNNFPQDCEKISRKIVRFKNMLETSRERIIFIRKSHGEHHHKQHHTVVDDIDDAIQLDALLTQKYPSLQYEIHVILICGPCFIDMKREHVSSNIQIHNIARPHETGVDITNPYYFDDCCRKLFTTLN
jgi:hypothetical protein